LLTGLRPLIALNAAALVIAMLYVGRDLLVPLVLAVMLAFVLAPATTLLRRVYVPNAPAVLLVVTVALAAVAAIGLVAGREAAALAQSLPAYTATIQAKIHNSPLGAYTMGQAEDAVRSLLGSTRPPGSSPSSGLLGDGAVLSMVRSLAPSVLAAVATMGIVAVFAIFVLLARDDLRDRMVRLVGRNDLHRTIVALGDAAHRLTRYFVIQLALNAGFGTYIAGGLSIIGLPNPILWGVLAALMRFLPFIGTYIAVLPPLLLALAVDPGWSLAIEVALLFGLGDLIMGQAIEPLMFGQSTGLSPIAIVLSASFWALIWGPVGLVISTPLTVCLVVMGRNVEALAFLDVILGDRPPLTPPERFYQRALEHNGRALVAQARAGISHADLVNYCDEVALRGLMLAQADAAAGKLEFDALEGVHAAVAEMLARLPALGSTAAEVLPDAWRAPCAVLCIPARGPLDDLAAALARDVLCEAGLGAAVQPNGVLRAGGTGEYGHVRLCCLSVMEHGSNPAGVRFLLRRIAKQMPGSLVVVALWHADGASPMLAALRQEGGEENIVLSLGELVALARALAAR